MEYKKEIKNCQNCKNDFTIESEDFSFYNKIKVPPPTFCPECRFQRRLMFRNNRVFYRRECGMCHKSMLSIYSTDKPYIVYCKECWLSDKWDPLDYGKEYDFSKPFFEQFKELQLSVPRANMYQTNFISSEYCNYGKDFKDCYLLFGGAHNERIYFSNQVFDSRDSMDLAFSDKVEFSYSLLECQKSNNLLFSQYSSDCVDSSYLIDCRNCMSCFGCIGLVNKQYYIFNQPYTRDEYLKFVSENQGSYAKHLMNIQKLNELKLSLPHRYARIYKSVNSDGDDSSEMKNAHLAFSSIQVENSKFLFFCRYGSKESYDVSFLGFNSELVYENCHAFGGNNTAFGVRNFNNQGARYNQECHECKDIFGCEGLRKKQYCILNKQYTKEEYESLLPRIMGHMEDMPFIDSKGRVYKYGEFFPADLSTFSYNESIAGEYFPLSKDEIITNGYQWKDADARNYQISLKNENIPDHINDVSEDILTQVISCEHGGECLEQCTEAFKITREEFKFYKRMKLPLPRLCPNCRHYQRLKARNPLKLWERLCMCKKIEHSHGEDACTTEFKTSYSPDRPEMIYCEKCYQQEVY